MPLQLLLLVRTFWWEDSSAFDLATEWLPSPIATNYTSQLHQVSQGVCATPKLQGKLVMSLALAPKDFKVPAILSHMIGYYGISFGQINETWLEKPLSVFFSVYA